MYRPSVEMLWVSSTLLKGAYEELGNTLLNKTFRVFLFAPSDFCEF